MPPGLVKVAQDVTGLAECVERPRLLVPVSRLLGVALGRGRGVQLVVAQPGQRGPGLVRPVLARGQLASKGA